MMLYFIMDRVSGLHFSGRKLGVFLRLTLESRQTVGLAPGLPNPGIWDKKTRSKTATET
jgi:hypothetical protein